MGLFEDLEKRLGWVRHDLTEAEALLHSRIAEEILGCAQTVLSILPNPLGREAALVITKMEEAAQWAHKALSLADSVATTVEHAPTAPHPTEAAPTETAPASVASAAASAAAADPTAAASQSPAGTGGTATTTDTTAASSTPTA